MTAGEIIVAYQGSRRPHLSDAALAKLLDTDTLTLARIKSGELKPDGRIRQACRKNAPELFIALMKVFYGDWVSIAVEIPRETVEKLKARLGLEDDRELRVWLQGGADGLIENILT